MAPTQRQQQQLIPSTLDPVQADADDMLVHRYQAGLFEAPYFSTGRVWDDYVPAYRFGQQQQRAHGQQRFADVEPRLADAWEAVRGQSRLCWVEARGAVEHAWARSAQQRARADAGRDGASFQAG